MSTATVSLKGWDWVMTLPCGDSIRVEGPYAQVPQVCPMCKRKFVNVFVVRNTNTNTKKHVAV